MILFVTYDFDFKNFVVVAVVLVIIVVLGYRLLNRDERIRKTRFGFFVERDRYEDEQEFVPPYYGPSPKTKSEDLSSEDKDTETHRWPAPDRPYEPPPVHGWPNKSEDE